jgi:hypothetical protein
MTKDEALKEAEKSIKDLMRALAEGRIIGDDYQPVDVEASATLGAIKDALAQPAQPAQEPVAWSWVPSEDWGSYFTEDASKAAVMRERGLEVRPLYTTPPQRPWVGLTGELTRNELLELANTFYTGGFTEREIAFARVIAAAIRARSNK